MISQLLLASLAVALLTGCSGQSCDGLAAMQAERDAARTAYVELVRTRPTAPGATEQADEDLHQLEDRVLQLEQSCD